MGRGFGAELTRSMASKLQAQYWVPQRLPLEIKLRLERLALSELVQTLNAEHTQLAEGQPKVIAIPLKLLKTAS